MRLKTITLLVVTLISTNLFIGTSVAGYGFMSDDILCQNIERRPNNKDYEAERENRGLICKTKESTTTKNDASQAGKGVFWSKQSWANGHYAERQGRIGDRGHIHINSNSGCDKQGGFWFGNWVDNKYLDGICVVNRIMANIVFNNEVIRTIKMDKLLDRGDPDKALIAMLGFVKQNQNQLTELFTDVTGEGSKAKVEESKAKAESKAYVSNNPATVSIETLTNKANNGDAYVMHELASLYIHMGNYEEAFKWWKKSAELGNSHAQKDLGHLYMWGMGVPANLELAEYWLTKSVDAGNEWAFIQLGELYVLAGSYPTALKWFNKALESNNAQLRIRAMNGIGFLYQKEGDTSKSIIWWQQAAELGNQWAQSDLGYAYLNGDGIGRDIELAKKWLTLAADQGNEWAQEGLAKLNEQ